MKKLFYPLIALSLCLTACEEQQPLEYNFQDIRCLYSPEYSISQENASDNTAHVVFQKGPDNKLDANIRYYGSALSERSDEELVALVQEQAKEIMDRHVFGSDRYSFPMEPYNQVVKPDRHSLERMIFESVWTYEGTKNGNPVYGAAAVKTVGNYLVSLFYEASTREEMDKLVDIDYSFRLK